MLFARKRTSRAATLCQHNKWAADLLSPPAQRTASGHCPPADQIFRKTDRPQSCPTAHSRRYGAMSPRERSLATRSDMLNEAFDIGLVVAEQSTLKAMPIFLAEIYVPTFGVCAVNQLHHFDAPFLAP